MRVESIVWAASGCGILLFSAIAVAVTKCANGAVRRRHRRHEQRSDALVAVVVEPRVTATEESEPEVSPAPLVRRKEKQPAVEVLAPVVVAPPPPFPEGPPSCPAGGLVGQVVIGRTRKYELLKVTGQGGFGVVYEAATTDGSSQRYAVKVVPRADFASDPQFRDRLNAEADIMARIDHPNVLGLEEKVETMHYIFLVTKFLAGGELFDRIVQKGQYTEEDAAVVMRQVIEGVEYLHSRGVCHRDLKPENLLYRTKDTNSAVVITDFTLAKIFTGGSLLKTRCGTQMYVAPEVLVCEEYTEACDMWAVGCITFILLTGVFPFEEQGQQGLIQQVIGGDWNRAELDFCKVSPLAKDFIEHLLLVDSKKRLTAAQALKHEWLGTGHVQLRGKIDLRRAQNSLRGSIRAKVIP